MLSIPYEQRPPLIGRQPSIWVDRAHAEALTQNGIPFLTPIAAVEACLDRALTRYATHFIGIQETRELLASAEADYPELVREAQKVASLQKIAEILRRLAEENVPIRNLRLVLEALVEWGQREQDVVLLVEYVRVALGRQICFRIADKNRVIAAYVLERALEEALRSAVRQTAVGTFLSVPDDAARPLVEQVRKALASARPDTRPVILAAMDIRRHVRNVLIRNELDLSVLSYQELAPEFSVQPLGTIYNRLESAGERSASRSFALPASAGAA
jgi:type III secretion protein V